MTDQALPNDVLHLIFGQLQTGTFPFRKTQKLNRYWKNWVINETT